VFDFVALSKSSTERAGRAGSRASKRSKGPLLHDRAHFLFDARKVFLLDRRVRRCRNRTVLRSRPKRQLHAGGTSADDSRAMTWAQLCRKTSSESRLFFGGGLEGTASAPVRAFDDENSVEIHTGHSLGSGAAWPSACRCIATSRGRLSAGTSLIDHPATAGLALGHGTSG